MTIGAFIEQVEQETGYMFVYNKREVDANRMVLLKAGSSSVADCLNRVLMVLASHMFSTTIYCLDKAR